MEERDVEIKHQIMKAKIYLQWENGRTASMGTLQIEPKDKEVKLRGLWRFRQLLGWEFVRTGFRIMLPGRKWKTEINTQ